MCINMCNSMIENSCSNIDIDFVILHPIDIRLANLLKLVLPAFVLFNPIKGYVLIVLSVKVSSK